jgi:hypothetical protein
MALSRAAAGAGRRSRGGPVTLTEEPIGGLAEDSRKPANLKGFPDDFAKVGICINSLSSLHNYVRILAFQEYHGRSLERNEKVVPLSRCPCL